ncbi:SCP-like protein, partial [Ancylostoma caninum]
LCSSVNYFKVLLCVNEALSVCSNDPQNADVIRTKILNLHNAARKAIVSVDGLEQSDKSKLPGSRNLFKVTYDCFLEGLAMIAASNCPGKPRSDHIAGEKAVNYAIKRRVSEAPADGAAYVKALEEAMAKWVDYRYEGVLDKNVTYKDAAMEPYANIIYNNTVAVGCSTIYCPNKKRISTACIYSGK